jgi:lipid A disaccharide synthetase
MTPEREAELRELLPGAHRDNCAATAHEALDAVAQLRKEWAEEHEMWHNLKDQLRHKRQRISSWRKLLNTWIDRAKKAEALDTCDDACTHSSSCIMKIKALHGS